jgi:hypothetical protein
MRTRLSIFVSVIAIAGGAACTGSQGPAGMNGTNGTNGMNGSNGMDGNDIILSERAKIGLDIAPVKLDLTGKDGPTIEKIGQGSYWVNAVIDCSGCHSSQAGYLAGGNQFPFAVPGETGDYVVSRNLTPDPTGLMLSEADFITALTTGRDFSTANGVLVVMPWVNLRWMHTDDLKAIYAYLKAIPAVANANQTDHKGLAGQLTPVALPATFAVGEQTRPITPETDFMGAPLPDPDGVERGIEVNPLKNVVDTGDPNEAAFESAFGRGSYLVNAAVCNDCHTNPPYNTLPGPTFLATNTPQFLAGGGVFPTPPGLGPVFGNTRSMSANLIGETHGFFNEPGMSFELFREIITTGLHVDDPSPRPLAWPMPYDHFRNMTEGDLSAVFTYVSTLAALEPRTDVGATINDKLTQGAAIYCDATHACPSGAGFTCHMDATVGNECVGNTCTDDGECGACQHCTGTTTKTCTAPDPTNQADAACAAGAGI